MKLKSVANYFMIIAICILLVGCGGSSDEKNTGSADQLRKEYETAMSSLNLSGASFSRSKSNSNTIVLSFDDLNKRVQDASTTEEKIKLMTAAVSAMNEFSSKADALLGNDTIGSSERSEVSTKRNMVVKRSSEARKLLATFAVRLNKEKELEIETVEKEADKPFFIKGKERKIHLCSDDFDSEKTLKEGFVRFRRQTHAISELSLVKAILCIDQSKYDSIKRSIGANEERTQNYRTSLYLPVDNSSNHEQSYSIILPLNSSRAENKVIEYHLRYSDREEPLNSNILIQENLFVLFSIVESELDITNQVIDFLKTSFLEKEGSMELLASLNENKEEILSKFTDDKIKNLLNRKFELAMMKTTDEVIEYIIAKDYISLERFASPKNSNKVSYNRSLKLNDSFSAYGFSPLMVAAILDDTEAVEILLSIEGIDPNFESPVFKRNYINITSLNGSTLSSLQSLSGGGSGSPSGSSSSGAGGGGGGSSATSQRIKKANDSYRGYTSLMIAVAEQKCDVVSAILEVEPQTVNYKTSYGRSALQVSASYGGNYCLKQLLEAGAFDIEILKDNYNRFPLIKIENLTQRKGAFTQITANDLVKNVDEGVWAKPDVIKDVRNILIFSNLRTEIKEELIKKVNITIEDIRTLLGTVKINMRDGKWRSSGLFGGGYSSGSIELSRNIDLKIVSDFGFDFASEKIFGDSNKTTIFSYVFERINMFSKGNSIETRLTSFLSKFSEINPIWVTDWLNSESSFKGRNPLVTASMYNEVDMVKALVSFDGINVNIVDKATGFNAYEWQYGINSFMSHFSFSKIAYALSEKNALIRSEVSNLLGKPNKKSKEEMVMKFNSLDYPFTRKSETTIEAI